MDITYLPMHRGFIYLAAVMDWAARRVLAWRVCNTLTADFRVEAVEAAIARYGNAEIFNTDQGTQFTSDDFTTMLHSHGVAIPMDRRGCWRDNLFVERLWRSSKCAELTASVRQCERGQSRRRTMPRLLQRPTTAYRARRSTTRRGILRRTHLTERGANGTRFGFPGWPPASPLVT